MRNGTGGELRLHLTVSHLSNPIYCNGAGTSLLGLQQQGTALLGEEGCYSLRPPNLREVTGFAFLASSYCGDMQHQMNCPCIFKGNSHFEPDEISAQRMGQINKIFHFVWAGFPPLMVVMLFWCLWTRTHKWKPIQIRPSYVLTLVSRHRMDRKHINIY